MIELGRSPRTYYQGAPPPGKISLTDFYSSNWSTYQRYGETVRSAWNVAQNTSGGGTVLYGPDGSEWPVNTVGDSTSFNVTVSSVSGLLSAIAAVTTTQANNGYRIGISGTLDLSPSSVLIVPMNSALDAASQAILVRPVTPGAVKASNGIQMQCSNVALAYIDIYSNFSFYQSPVNTWLTRCHGIGAATVNVHSGLTDTSVYGGRDCGVVGCIYPDYTAGAVDRIHISPSYAGSGHTPGHAMHNFSILRSWFEGIPYTSGHADQLQIDGLSGTMLCQNSFMGPAGDNGNPQAKPDIFWSVDAPFCTVVYDTCTLSGAQTDGQGNASNQGGPYRGYNNVYYDVSSSMAFRYDDGQYYAAGSDCVLDGCTFYGSINYASTTGITVTNATYYSASLKANARPPLPHPPWQWW